MSRVPPQFLRFFDDAATFPPGLAPVERAVRGHVARRSSPVLPAVGPAVLALAERFAASTAQQRAQIPVLPPRRADVIAAGSLIAARVGARVGVDLQVSESDILDGIALGLLG